MCSHEKGYKNLTTIIDNDSCHHINAGGVNAPTIDTCFNGHIINAHVNKPHTYELKLLSDEDVLATAECVYGTTQLKSKKYTLDSGLFGASPMNSTCVVCFQPIEQCIGHFSVAILPFPIIKALCIKDTKVLIPLMCPCCSRLIIQNASDALSLPVSDRLGFIKKETEKYTRKYGNEFYCYHCKHKIHLIKAYNNEPTLRFKFVDKDDTLVNPIVIADMLANFTEINEIGYSDNFHPRNYMTYVLPLIPTKLRPKNVINTESTITSYYRSLIESIIPQLSEIKKSLKQRGYLVNIESTDSQNKFLKAYDKLTAFYMLITDISTERVKEAALQMIEKRDRKHVDPHNALIGRIKGKETSIFNKGIVATRHNVSARTVLGAAVEAKIKQISVPYHVANKLSMMYPVYEQNIKFMRQLVARTSEINTESDVVDNVANMSMLHKARVINVLDSSTGRVHKVTPQNAVYRAGVLKPGDKVSLSLIDTDIVAHSRFPIIREESFSTFQVKKDSNDIVCIPLAACDMKMADMDGDETQIYVGSGHYLDIESLLLNSSFAQYIAYKDGNPGMWFPWSADAAYGLQKIDIDRKCIIENENYTKEYNVIERVNALLPKDLNYCDSKIEIRNGKVIKAKPTFRNSELFKYINSIYGSETALNLMDELTKVAYDLNRDEGCTLGYDIRITHAETKKKIKEIIKETEKKMRLNEISNMDYKDIYQLLATENQKVQIKQLLIDDAKGTNIDRAGYTTLRQEEFYQTVALADSVNLDGLRVQPVLANGMRTCSAYPRNTIDPQAYGYIPHCYNEGLSTVNHFFETKQHRLNIYQRGAGTADQGYSAKRFVLNYGRVFMDFNGAVVSNKRNISTIYGACGLNPRAAVMHKLVDINLDKSEFDKKYSNDKELCNIHDELCRARSRYGALTSFSRDDVFNDDVIVGFNYDQYIKNNMKSGSTCNEEQINKINEFIKLLRDVYVPNYESTDDFVVKDKLKNLMQHEYYFRIALRNIELDKVHVEYLINKFVWSLADGGDAVGYKASLATTEPLVQASLHSIHNLGAGADVERIQRSTGIVRYKELINGDKAKDTVVTIKLWDDSEEACKRFANEQETFYLNDIWTDMHMIDINTKIPDIIKKMHKRGKFDKVSVAKQIIVMTWDLSQIGAYKIHVTDVISRLYEAYSEIAFITGHIVNLTQFKAFIFFKPTIQTNAITALMDTFTLIKPQNVVNGGYLKNCFVYKDKNSSKDGKEHWLMDANESIQGNNALGSLIYDERVNPRGSRSNDINAQVGLFGICEAQTRHYEELIYTTEKFSATRGVLSRHYKVLSDTTFANGVATYGSRNSLRHDNEIDVLRLINFETPRDMITQSLKFANVQEAVDPISANVFGELPCFGTGVSKITIVKSGQ